MEAHVGPHQAVLLPRDARRLHIALVSGVRFVREALAEILERDPLVSVVEVCTDLIEVVALRPILQADVVLVDATIPEGPNALRRALDIAPEMRIVAFAVTETEDDIVAWAEAGVIGYIPSTVASQTSSGSSGIFIAASRSARARLPPGCSAASLSRRIEAAGALRPSWYPG